MNDRQALALKPRHPHPGSQTPFSATSPAALRGATTAFLPKASGPATDPSPTSVGARLAALSAGTNARQRALHISPERQDGKKESSPPRGRYLNINASALSGAVRSTSSSNQRSNPERPSLPTRSSSTLAARHASAHSRSPRRSPTRGPIQSGTSATTPKNAENRTQRPDALSGAVASLSAALVRHQTQSEVMPSVKARVLDFEKVPALPAPQASLNLNSDSSKRDNTSSQGHNYIGSKPHKLASHETPVANPTSGYAGGQTPTSFPTSPRQSSGESVTTITRFAATKADQADQSTRNINTEYPTVQPGRPSASWLQNLVPATPRHTDDHRSTLTVNALADAMVASSIASSRAASPSRKHPPPVPRRRSRSVTALYELQSGNERAKHLKAYQPPRPMKQTLRKDSSSDEEVVELTKRGRRHWMRKHPNMYAEGDRKRWRDKVTDPERRRYEGVFAANRGILIGNGIFEPSLSAISDQSALGNHVVNVVTRDVWERSRLPREVLREIYDLVSPEEAHVLNREQFVVGLWLIDQRLKGRKLPVKVSASVWASVRHSQGIRIRKHHS